MSFVKLQDGRSTYALDSIRLRNQREATTAPQANTVELYMKEGVLYQVDEEGRESKVSILQSLQVIPLEGITQAERLALSAVAGMIVYDTTNSKHYGYDGTAWQALY